jgi:hypothetical protein
MPDKTMRVYPSPKLGATEYVPGVGADGADVPIEEAEAMLESGIVVKNKPKAPDSPAEPEDNK